MTAEHSRNQWIWRPLRWQLFFAGYFIVCILGILFDQSFPTDTGMGQTLPILLTIILSVVSLLTDRAWNVTRRIVWGVAIVPLWLVVITVVLFLGTRIGIFTGLLPVDDAHYSIFVNIVHQISFVPFIAVALRRSTLFVMEPRPGATGTSTSALESQAAEEFSSSPSALLQGCADSMQIPAEEYRKRVKFSTHLLLALAAFYTVLIVAFSL